MFIRVSQNQYERIKMNAQAKGYVTVSAYIRDLTLGRTKSFEDKFDELYKFLMKNNSNK